MELSRDKIIRELDTFHSRILNGNLAERITEKEIMAIINAASLLIEDEKTIKKLTNAINEIQTRLDECSFVDTFSFNGKKMVFMNDVKQIVEELMQE